MVPEASVLFYIYSRMLLMAWCFMLWGLLRFTLCGMWAERFIWPFPAVSENSK